jgi:hypothetical protein
LALNVRYEFYIYIYIYVSQICHFGDRKLFHPVPLERKVCFVFGAGNRNLIAMPRVIQGALSAFALVAGVKCSIDVRLVDAAGRDSNVGVLQIKTDAGFGTVCGANAASADAIQQVTRVRSTHFCFQRVGCGQPFFSSRVVACRGDLQIHGLRVRHCEQFPL